jgi:hypothetical protein
MKPDEEQSQGKRDEGRGTRGEPDAKSPGRMSLGALEVQLRRLPAPKVPDGLEGRLVDAIPAAPQAGPTLRRMSWGWLRPAAAIAAGLVLAVFMLHRAGYSGGSAGQHGAPIVTADSDVQERLAREASCAQLLAAAKALEQYPEGQSEAQRNYERIASVYGDTDVARSLHVPVTSRKGDIQ